MIGGMHELLGLLSIARERDFLRWSCSEAMHELRPDGIEIA